MNGKKTLRELREERKVTREKLAAAVEATFSTIVRLESRRHRPRVDLAIRIAQYFGVAVEDIDWSTVGEGKQLAAA